MMKSMGNFLLRILLGFVFLFTGVGKLFLGMIPADMISGILNGMGMSFIPAMAFGYALGVIELIVGLMLILGLFTKITAWVAAVLLLSFIIGVSIILGDGIAGSAMMFKDLGLLGGALALAFQGSSFMSMDTFLKER